MENSNGRYQMITVFPIGTTPLSWQTENELPRPNLRRGNEDDLQQRHESAQQGKTNQRLAVLTHT